LQKDENYLMMVTDYFINYLKPTKSQFEFENQGDYIQYIKRINIIDNISDDLLDLLKTVHINDDN
jgi:hypothetical protein